VKYNKNYFYLVIPFFFDQPTAQTRGWIFTRDSSKDVKSRKDVHFCGYKTNLILNPYSCPKIVKFWPKMGLSFFNRKCLTMGALKIKLPLIIIVAP